MHNYKFPLQTDPFTLLDRLKICSFLLNKKNRLTMGDKVAELENKFKEYTRAEFAVATSSGSTANHLLVETFFQTYGYEPENVVVFIPATTWASSVTSWLQKGCEVVYVDINLEDFCFDYSKLEEAIKKEHNGQNRAKVIFPTFLIGFLGDIERLKKIKDEYVDCYLFADLCECTLVPNIERHPSSIFDMSTTSFFFAHQICSIEGGMLFINDPTERYYYKAKMIRNHGLIRSLFNESSSKIKSFLSRNMQEAGIDYQFYFVSQGTNYRMSDLHALFGLLDFERLNKYIEHRQNIWKIFNKAMFCKPYFNFRNQIVPFSLPIISKSKNYNMKEKKGELKELGWETRPIISFIPVNPAFHNEQNLKEFPNSQYLHEYGFYVGINGEVKEKDIKKLVQAL